MGGKCLTGTGNIGLDALADAIAERVMDRMEQGKKRLLRIKEAAQYLGVSRRSVDSYIANGQIPHVREGGVIRIDRDDLDRWIEMRKGKG
jgi:excisionase family DNA binding protein